LVDKELLYAMLSLVVALAVAIWLIDQTVYDIQFEDILKIFRKM